MLTDIPISLYIYLFYLLIFLFDFHGYIYGSLLDLTTLIIRIFFFFSNHNFLSQIRLDLRLISRMGFLKLTSNPHSKTHSELLENGKRRVLYRKCI